MKDTSRRAPRISLVVPARNEEARLAALLESVEVARARYRGGAGAVEVIVSDNASGDDTARVAAAHGCRVVRESRRIIAAVRNAGAKTARGGLLAFVDADSCIHPETFNAVDDAIATDRVVGGATGVRLDRWSPGILAAYLAMLPMVWLTKMDTGLVFCRREDFVEIGGYDERLLFAEDVRLLWDLRRLGKGKGQGLARLRPVKAVTSTRKFDRHGDWHYLGVILRVIWWYFFPRPESMERFARDYWYGDDGTR
jgi:glycosyltransferase involved in cell wall biosynthesis